MKSETGFSLIEVMAAMIILSMSLIVLMQNQTQSISLAQKAKDWDLATTLASAKMSELTMLVEQQGFTALKTDESGEFDQEKFPTYKWRYWRQNVPQPNFQALMGMASGEARESGVSNNADALAGPLQMIGRAWSESLLELHVEVMWGNEASTRSFDLTTHLLANDTNRKIQAIVSSLGAR